MRYFLYAVAAVSVLSASFVLYGRVAHGAAEPAYQTTTSELAIPTSASGPDGGGRVSFGGRVILTQIPGVTCTGSGTGPVVLSSNASGAFSSTANTIKAITTAAKQLNTDATNSGNPDPTAIVGPMVKTISDAYKILPFYLSGSGTPRPGGFVLGRHPFMPDLSTCSIQLAEIKIPFPVFKSSKYGVSH